MPASALADTLVDPAFCTHPPYADTLGPEVSDLCAMAGFAPDPEQRLGLDLIFAMGPDGRAAALETAVVCSRQNLKTGLFKQAALGWLFLTDQRLVVWSAHEFRTAQEAFRDLTELIEGCPYLDRRVANIYRGNGDEAIELLGGRRLIFKARTKAGGRGLSGDKVVLDEAFALHASHMGALLPTLSARPDPQVLYGSSAGLVESDVLRSVRDRGRAGGEHRLAYVEWCDDLPGDCAEDGCDHHIDRAGCRLDDRRRWRRANPAMGRRITEDYIAAERRALPPAEFARERLGWWDAAPEEIAQWRVIPFEQWVALADEHSQPIRRPGQVAFAVEMSWDRTSAAIGVCGRREDGLFHVEIPVDADGRPDYRSGPPHWLPPRLKQLVEQWRPIRVVVNGKGPAGTLIADIEALGVEVYQPTYVELGQAFGRFRDTVEAGGLRHLNEPVLSTALAGAVSRKVGDAHAWDMKEASTDSAPLIVATNALWGLATAPAPQRFFASYR